jgi:4-hydroxy-tetrahydrodipicolinate reductase
MQLLIFGTGPLGRAVERAARDRGWPDPVVAGRPPSGAHDPVSLPIADVVVDASGGAAVAANVAAALEAGNRLFVLAATAWEADLDRVERLVLDRAATAVVAPNLSLGVALFGRLVDAAVGLFGPLPAFDPFVLEWHRRTKADRPSGTARELARRIVAGHPRKSRIAEPSVGGPEPDELDVAVIRAGGSPGMHLVGFDAPGETVELRVTARDRSAYSAGALAAAEWLATTPRTPGLVSFDAVVDDLLAATGAAPVAPAA